MGIFLLPISLCKELEGIMSKFWWSHSKQGRQGVHWTRWSSLSRHKSRGGLGFRDLHDYNLALLCKQGWKFLSHLEALVSRLYKAKYFPFGQFLSAALGCNPSYTWRSLVATQE